MYYARLSRSLSLHRPPHVFLQRPLVFVNRWLQTLTEVPSARAAAAAAAAARSGHVIGHVM